MADTSNLTQFLTDVATAIKNKKGTTNKIPAANFDTEISSIETGGKVKLFNTVAEMNASTDNKDGDIALIYGINPVEPNTTGFAANTLILPEELPADITLDNSNFHIGESGYGPYIANFSVGTYSGTQELSISQIEMGMGGMSYEIYSRKSDTETWKRYNYNSYNYGSILYLDNIPIIKEQGYQNGEYTVKPTAVVANTSATIWNYIKFANINTIEVYQYTANNTSWHPCRSKMNIDASNLKKDKVMLGGEGLITGTYTLDMSKRACYNTVQAIAGSSLQNASALITNTENAIVCYNPDVKFGDKRFFIYNNRMSQGMGAYGSVYFDDPDTVLTYSSDTVAIPTGGKFFKDEDNTDTLYKNCAACNEYNNDYNSPTIQDIKNLSIITSLGDTNASSYGYYTYGNGFMITNCKVVNSDGVVLQEAGPKASTTLKGQHYINIFGERVEGTYEQPMTTEEYNTASNTADKILGTIDNTEIPDTEVKGEFGED